MWAIHTQRWDIENDGRQERSITDSVSQPTRPPSHTISSLLFPRSRTGNMPTFLVRPFLLAFLFFIYSSLLRYTHVSWTPIFRVPRRLRMALTTYAYRRTLTRSTSYIIYIFFFVAVILSRQSSFYLGAAASSSFPRSHFTTDPEDCLGFPRASDLHPRDQSPPPLSHLFCR